MHVSWSIKATVSLKGYYEGVQITKGVKAARSWRKKIFDRTEHLKAFPRHGRLEKTTLNPELEHRSLLEGNFRIVYLIEGAEITILQLFNTRQNPDTLVF